VTELQKLPKMSEQMKNNSDSPSCQPVLCATGCGFWGNPLNLNLCSKCYKDYLVAKEKEHQDRMVEAPAEQSDEGELERMDTDEAPNTSAEVGVSATEAPPVEAPPKTPETVLGATTSSPPEIPSKTEEEEEKAKSIIASCVTPPPPPPLEELCTTPCVSSGGEERERRIQKNTSRCMECNKKIGLTGFKCKCGYFFCSSHRYADSHKCDFDYKAAGRAQLAKNNPLVVADKVTRI